MAQEQDRRNFCSYERQTMYKVNNKQTDVTLNCKLIRDDAKAPTEPGLLYFIWKP